MEKILVDILNDRSRNFTSTSILRILIENVFPIDSLKDFVSSLMINYKRNEMIYSYSISSVRYSIVRTQRIDQELYNLLINLSEREVKETGRGSSISNDYIEELLRNNYRQNKDLVIQRIKSILPERFITSEGIMFYELSNSNNLSGDDIDLFYCRACNNLLELRQRIIDNSFYFEYSENLACISFIEWDNIVSLTSFPSDGSFVMLLEDPEKVKREEVSLWRRK